MRRERGGEGKGEEERRGEGEKRREEEENGILGPTDGVAKIAASSA
jgi:hypothetical protein